LSRTNFQTDPAAFALVRDQASYVVANEKTRVVLGIDLGTNCGYTFAFYKPGVPVTPGLISPRHMGQWDLSAGSYDSGAIRFLRLRHFLAAAKPDAVFYEDVKFDPPGINKINAGAVLARVATASEFLGACKATTCCWCEEHNIPCTGFKIGTIKKRATGHGNANKEDMIKACNKLFGASFETEGYETTGVDNIADSSFVCLLGLEQYASGLEPVHEA
jgi:hypothetical protein